LRGTSESKLPPAPPERKAPCRLGQTVRWTPSVWDGDTRFPGATPDLRGTVVYINLPHRYYTVEALHHGVPLRESFKF